MKDDIIYGRKPILEALEGKRKFEKILIAKGSDFYQQVYQAIKGKPVQLQVVPEQKLNRITRKNHQGVIGYVGYVDYQSVENVLAKVYETGETPLFIMLDGVTDVGNMGAIARSAYAMGAHAVIVPEKGSALINGVAVKASAGAVEKINFCKVRVLGKTIEQLQMNGLTVFATTLTEGAKDISEVDFTLPCCIIMGNEEKGVGANLCAQANEEIFIPMKRSFDSLNVSVATGIVLHECLKQRSAL